MSMPSRGALRQDNTPIDITEEDILKHILFWKHLPNNISFNDKSLQTILEQFDPEDEVEVLPSKLVAGTPAHKRAIEIVTDLKNRPIIIADRGTIIDMFNWLRFSEHMILVNKEPAPFHAKVTRALDFKLRPRETIAEVSIFEQLEQYRADLANPEIIAEEFDFGIESLDSSTKLARGNFVICAARPGSGKTTLSMFIGLINALQGKRVMFLSLEMKKHQILNRIDGFMNARNISKEEQAKLQFTIKYNAPKDLATFKTYIKNEIAIDKPDILIIDYIQLFNGGDSNTNRYTVIADSSKFFKGLAMDADLALITCSQVSRSTTTFGVTLADLFGSSELEADADIVLAIERGSAGFGGEILQPALIKLLKNRDGEPIETQVLINYGSMNIIEDSDEILMFND